MVDSFDVKLGLVLAQVLCNVECKLIQPLLHKHLDDIMTYAPFATMH